MARNKGTTEAGIRRRAQILRQTESLVEDIGFNDFTMESIANSIGIAKSTLYHYFPQKEDMLFAIHQETMSEQTEHLRAIVALSAPATERFRLLIRDQLRLIAQHPGRVRVLMDSRTDKDRPYRKEMAQLERTYFDELTQFFEKAMSESEFLPANPKLVAEAVLGMTQHARYWLRSGSSADYQSVADELWMFLCRGLTPSVS